MKTLFVAWQNPKTRSWFTVGRLRQFQGAYEFVYTYGAVLAGPEFIPFGRFRSLVETYVSDELFPLFANRTLPESRPEYREFLSWLGLPSDTTSAVEVLARSGGRRATDSLEIFPCPERNEEGELEIEFFVRGLRYLPPGTLERILQLRARDKLYMMFDVQNPEDPKAVAVRTDDPPAMIGYCPRYLAHDLRQVVWSGDQSEIGSLQVLQVNKDAPLQYLVLCKFVARWPEGFEPCTAAEYQPIDRTRTAEIASGTYYSLPYEPRIPRPGIS